MMVTMEGSADMLRKGKRDRMINRLSKSARRVAEALAIQALSFIGADPERLGHFLAATGIGPTEIRAAARDSHFLAGVLDYVAANEQLLIDFAADANVTPTEVTRAHAVLGNSRWERDTP
ncbi:MAG: DUF3572 domain-containing protein [Pseudorhodoplanes sp.]